MGEPNAVAETIAAWLNVPFEAMGLPAGSAPTVGFISIAAFLVSRIFLACELPHDEGRTVFLRILDAVASYPIHYYRLGMTGVLKWADHWIGDDLLDRRGDQLHAWWRDWWYGPANPWSLKSYDRCITLAIVYPIMGFTLVWLTTGRGTFGGVWLMDTLNWPWNLVIAAEVCLILSTFLFFRSSRHGGSIVRRFLLFLDDYSGRVFAVASILAGALALAFALAGVGAVSFAVSGGLAVTFAATVAATVAGSLAFTRAGTLDLTGPAGAAFAAAVGVAGAVAFAVAGAVAGAGTVDGAVASTLAVTFAVTIGLLLTGAQYFSIAMVFAAILMSGLFYTFTGAGRGAMAGAGAGVVVVVVFAVFRVFPSRSKSHIGAGFSSALQWIWLNGALCSAMWLAGSSSAGIRIVLLFLGYLPLVNAPLDWLSLGLTRGLLREARLRGRGWGLLYSTVDLLLGAALMFPLVSLAVAAIRLANAAAIGGGGTQLLDLQSVIAAIRDSPGDPAHFWVYLVFLSTLVPTAVHALVAVVGAVTGVVSWFGIASGMVKRFVGQADAHKQTLVKWVAPALISMIVGSLVTGAIAGGTHLGGLHSAFASFGRSLIWTAQWTLDAGA